MCHQVCLKDLTHRVQVCHLRADIGVIDQGSIMFKKHCIYGDKSNDTANKCEVLIFKSAFRSCSHFEK